MRTKGSWRLFQIFLRNLRNLWMFLQYFKADSSTDYADYSDYAQRLANQLAYQDQHPLETEQHSLTQCCSTQF
jgi:hypothetical protein